MDLMGTFFTRLSCYVTWGSMLLQFCLSEVVWSISTVSGVDRSNIFGITKDNHFNAVCLVLWHVAFRFSSIPSLLFIIQSFLPLWRSAETPCMFSSCGGGRMYPISINLRAESDLCAFMCAHVHLSIKQNTLLGEGGVSSWSSLRRLSCHPPASKWGSWPVAAHSTLQICDLWILYKNDYLTWDITLK